MSGTFTIHKISAPEIVISKLAPFAMSRNCFLELGEPVLYLNDTLYYVCEYSGNSIGFAAVQKSKTLRYLFTDQNFRGIGCASALLNEISKDFSCTKLDCVSTAAALNFYLKRDWKIKTSFKNYHKLKQ